MTRPSVERDPIRFAEKLMVLLDQGGRTSTYKFAVLIGLLDLCLRHGGEDGSAPGSVTTRQLADQIIELYWPHTRPFDQGPVLRQNSGGQAEILSLIARFREWHAPDPSASLFRARLHAPAAFERLRDDVEWKLVQMPLPKLQRVGQQVDAFIYTIGWDDRVTRGELRGDRFDNRILFQPHAAEHLVRLAGVLRPLVYRQWAGMVARLNDLEQSRLEAFLFGRSREALAPVRAPLLDLQAGRCFYCHRGIRGGGHVDHFLPWARHPDDGLHNLVVAHEACNLAKSDFLAAADHLARWCGHLVERAADLEAIAADLRWPRDRARTVGAVRSIYVRLPDDVRLWRARGRFVPLERTVVRQALRGVTAGG